MISSTYIYDKLQNKLNTDIWSLKWIDVRKTRLKMVLLVLQTFKLVQIHFFI